MAVLLAVVPRPEAASPSPRLSGPEVDEAIRWGRRAAPRELEQYVLKVSPTWTVNFDTPFLRVAQLAHAYHKRERELKAGDIPASVLAPEVHVYALALQQPGVTEKVRNITHVTMRRPDTRDTVQPISVQTSVNRARGRGDFGAPAGLARSVEARFAQRDFAAGHVLRVEFQGGAYEHVELTRDALARAR